LHDELVALSELCNRDPDRAAQQWARLRELLHHVDELDRIAQSSRASDVAP
jgi:hypothetical protein